jgi:Flp pilus assembly protein TadD
MNGRAALGAATQWTTEEIVVIAELGYALAQQGRNEEAIAIFGGLAALAPATAYFQSALGALYLRIGDFERAENHLSAAIAGDSRDAAALINLGELLLHSGKRRAALQKLQAALDVTQDDPDPSPMAVRARALLAQIIQESSA